MEPQNPVDPDPALQELVRQCELLQAAAMLARSNAVEAYKVAIGGGTASLDPTAALAQYQTAKSLQQVAEQALFNHLEARRTFKEKERPA